MSDNVTTESASTLRLEAHIYWRMALSDKIAESVYLSLKRKEKGVFECDDENLDNRIQYVGQELSKYVEMPRPTDYDTDWNEISAYTQKIIEWIKDSRHEFIRITNENRRLQVEKERLAQSMTQNRDAATEDLEKTIKQLFVSLEEVQQILYPKKKRSSPSPEAEVIEANGTNDQTDELNIRLRKIRERFHDLAVTNKEYTNEARSLSDNIRRVEGWPTLRPIHINQRDLDRAVEKIAEATVNDLADSFSSQIADDYEETALYGHRLLENSARFTSLKFRKDSHVKETLLTSHPSSSGPVPSTPMVQLNLLREYRRAKQQRTNGINSKSAINTISRVLEETRWN